MMTNKISFKQLKTLLKEGDFNYDKIAEIAKKYRGWKFGQADFNRFFEENFNENFLKNKIELPYIENGEFKSKFWPGDKLIEELHEFGDDIDASIQIAFFNINKPDLLKIKKTDNRIVGKFEFDMDKIDDFEILHELNLKSNEIISELIDFLDKSTLLFVYCLLITNPEYRFSGTFRGLNKYTNIFTYEFSTYIPLSKKEKEESDRISRNILGPRG